MVLPIAALLMGMGAKNRYDETQREADAYEQGKKDHAEDRAYVTGQRDRTLRQQAVDDKLQASMSMAGSDVSATPNMVAPDTMDNRDVGLPGEQAPTQMGFRVGGKVLPDQVSADKAVADWNAPDAKIARMSDVLTAAGKPVEALDLSNKVAQSKVAKLQLDAAQRAAVNQAFDDDLNKRVNSFEDLGNFISNSNGDGQAGALKVKAVPSADGKKITMHRLNPDGTSTPTAYTFDNTAAGLTRAKAALSRSITLEGQLTHLHQQAQEDIAQAAQQSLSRYHDAMAVAAQTRADNVGVRASSRADHFDEKEWDSAQKIEPALVSFVGPDGGKGVESPELRLTYVRELNAARSRGDMSPSQAAEAARTATVMLRNKASELAAASGGKVSEQQAVQQLLSAYDQAQRQASRPVPSARDDWIRNAPPGSVTRPVASMADVAKPAASVAAPAAPQSVAQILGPGNSTLDNVMRAKAPAIETALANFRQAQTQFQAAAKSQDPKAIQHWAAVLTAARQSANTLLNEVPDERARSQIAATVEGL